MAKYSFFGTVENVSQLHRKKTLMFSVEIERYKMAMNQFEPIKKFDFEWSREMAF